MKLLTFTLLIITLHGIDVVTRQKQSTIKPYSIRGCIGYSNVDTVIVNYDELELWEI